VTDQEEQGRLPKDDLPAGEPVAEEDLPQPPPPQPNGASAQTIPVSRAVESDGNPR
jgi:hypothetical protein